MKKKELTALIKAQNAVIERLEDKVRGGECDMRIEEAFANGAIAYSDAIEAHFKSKELESTRADKDAYNIREVEEDFAMEKAAQAEMCICNIQKAYEKETEPTTKELITEAERKIRRTIYDLEDNIGLIVESVDCITQTCTGIKTITLHIKA